MYLEKRCRSKLTLVEFIGKKFEKEMSSFQFYSGCNVLQIHFYRKQLVVWNVSQKSEFCFKAKVAIFSQSYPAHVLHVEQ